MADPRTWIKLTSLWSSGRSGQELKRVESLVRVKIPLQSLCDLWSERGGTCDEDRRDAEIFHRTSAIEGIV